MKNILNLIEIAIAALLIVFILLQKQGGGLSSVFGGGGGDESYRTKRGMEKWLVSGTIILAVAFAGLAIIRMLI